MRVHYLDASSWIKRYYQEQGTEWVQALFVEGSILACATLGLVEVIATLSRKRKAHQLSQYFFQQKRVEVMSDWMQFIQIQMTDQITEKALKLTTDLALRGADAVHLASAVILQENLSDQDELILVASDNELLIAAEQSGLNIHNPSTTDATDSY